MRRLAAVLLFLAALGGALIASGLVRVRLNIEPAEWVSASPFWREEPGQAPLPPGLGVWVELARAVKPAVVNVSTTQRTPRPGPDDFFRRFFEGPQPPERGRQSLGSGFIVSADGYVGTNYHVVRGASEIVVRLADHTEHRARLVGGDPRTDIALLKIEAASLPTLAFGDSDRLQVGEPVMAIGNPFGLEQTVTTGIVSATGRVIGQGPYDDFVQTDASINPGNSGGPLINARGQAIGINAAIFSQSGGSVGIGFAIPSNQAKTVVMQLADSGRVSRSWLGVAIQPLTPELAKGFNLGDAKGALVSNVTDDSPADKAGIKAGDIITEYDGRKVARSEDLPRMVAETQAGREVPVTVLRDGKPVKLTARVSKLDDPDEKVAAEAGEKGKLGVAVEPVTPAIAKELGLKEAKGLVVKRVEDGSPAANAGIRAGDVILEVNRQPVKDVAGLRQIVDKHAKGTPMVMLVQRQNTTMYVAV